MKVCYCGIDNGVTGSLGFIVEDKETGYYKTEFILTPVFSELSYQKTKVKNINRIDFKVLLDLFKKYKEECERIVVAVERPMINATRFQASLSARASLEATLIVFNLLDISYTYIDSKQWQKLFLPNNAQGPELKVASKNVGIRNFPEHKDLISKHKDADGMLIALYAKRNL